MSVMQFHPELKISSDTHSEDDKRFALSFEKPAGAFAHTATALKLRNPNGKPVLFKVKTTAAKFYWVKPNVEVIPPGQSVEVVVTMHMTKPDGNKDKFLVQVRRFRPRPCCPLRLQQQQRRRRRQQQRLTCLLAPAPHRPRSSTGAARARRRRTAAAPKQSAT